VKHASVAWVLVLAGVAWGGGAAWADEPAPAKATGPQFKVIATLTKGLRLGAVGSKGRTPIHRDPVEARLVRGTWAPPKAGDVVTAAEGGTQTWGEVTAGAGGKFEGDDFSGGAYVSLPYESPEEKVVLFHAVGNDFAYVNGEMRPGDPYGTGWLRLPIVVRKGANELLVRVSRGSLRVTLEEPPAPVYISPDDATLPSPSERDGLVESGKRDVPLSPRSLSPGAVVVVNATRSPLGALSIAPKGLVAPSASRLGPLTLAKVPSLTIAGSGTTYLWLDDPANPVSSFTPRQADDAGSARPSLVTFRSSVDGSAQYWAMRTPPGSMPITSLVLSLHGAGVEARSQAASYAPHAGVAIVCPTNRRPFGFDWEDWGRLDALEVLDLATEALKPDPNQIYLTGHSMGGHGTWQLGCTFPDKFAAIGPSAGWPSFATYIGGPAVPPADPVEELLRRANNPSDTMALVNNLAPLGIYILHGDKDDNVPVEQARDMAKVLAGFHRDWRLFEQPGAGHWWDVSKAPGADCVDWPPMFEFFAKRRRAPEQLVTEVNFTTMDPAVSDRCYGVRITQQTHALMPSRIRVRRAAGDVTVEIENVDRFTFDDKPAGELIVNGKPTQVEEDEGGYWGAGPALVWERARGAFATHGLEDESMCDPTGQKNPRRGGSFKSAFRNHFRFVYGTAGTPEENAASYARARLDSETWYYRGNGGAEVLPDVELVAEKDRKDENVILYGNADTNAAWAKVLAGCPVRVARGKIVVGDKALAGDDLGCLFCYPRDNSTTALVGVVAGAGPAGLRVTERLPIFTSGVGFPDLTIVGADALERGTGGVRCAGFFGNDWSVEHGEFAWHDAPGAPPSPAPPTPVAPSDPRAGPR